MQTVTLTPLFKHSVGFDRFNDLFDTVFNEKVSDINNGYPPYNIEKHGEDTYRIVMAVAGFKLDELEIVLHNGDLTISAKVIDKDDDVEYLHKGIAKRAFSRKFSLTDYIKVVGADMVDGLLHIDLKREFPEEAKPKTIQIKGVREADKKAIEHQKDKK